MRELKKKKKKKKGDKKIIKKRQKKKKITEKRKTEKKKEGMSGILSVGKYKNRKFKTENGKTYKFTGFI